MPSNASVDRFLIVAFYSYLVCYALKFRHLERSGFEGLTAGMIFQDVAVLTASAFVLLVAVRRGRFLLLPLFFLTILNVLFLTKLGYPITRGLVGQVGDLMVVQTAIASPSMYLSAIALVVVCAVLVVLLLVRLPRFSRSLRAVFAIVLTALLASSAYGYTTVPQNKHYLGVNIVSSLLNPSDDVTGLLDFFEARYPDATPVRASSGSIEMDGIDRIDGSHRNVVVLVIETLSGTLPGDQLARAMPELTALRGESLSFEEHYTPYPFSSKSLYSIVCGRYPNVSSLIEMRIAGNVDCGGWIGTLTRDLSYDSYVGYTGDLLYDNMDTFFATQGFETRRDRTHYERTGTFETNDLSVDDASMIGDFVDWAASRQGPFVSLLITMNSHFPFWHPSTHAADLESDYLNALAYQDKLIGDLVDGLKRAGRYHDTVLVITGDHGPRVSEELKASLLPQSYFKVPLVIHGSGAVPARVDHPTSHSDLGPSLLGVALNVDAPDDDRDLLSEHPVYLFGDFGGLKIGRMARKRMDVLDGSDKTLYSGEPWLELDPCEQVCDTTLLGFYDFVAESHAYHGF